ncbi:SIS domain-containing protein [Mesobacillus subterraneus]|uniref:Tagatose-6-phosphate ketose isomerase n=1 Tax=Mesobacillus subterraneus TaxID=285983 RepID=A0A0D6ZE48_9BACI|nr:SIS domain-containing protein [Mesobacillus subterraneus]KIY23797.1 tagatose-6-phosphate ketose isomerase [Mesobacillus subterraneus]
MFLPLSKEKLISIGAESTVTEILQQPRLWKETYKIVKKNKDHIQDFLYQLSQRHEIVRFIFTGAGTSAYVGEIVVPYLKKHNSNNGWQFEATATTDIVSNPNYYLTKDIPTVMVSFARSGNSPESVAATEIGKQLVDHFYEIIFSCNPDGRLAKKAESSENSLTLLMPAESNDQGFAMTSSFTSMMMASLLLFQLDRLEELSDVVETISSVGEALFTELNSLLEEIIAFDFERIIYLGSGPLGSLARESALKVLELTAGKTISMYETPLGFRHGPKSIQNEKSLIVLYLSNDPYTRKYDLDLLAELHNEGIGKIVVLDSRDDNVVKEKCDWYVKAVPNTQAIQDIYLAFIYILFAQTLAVKKSIDLGLKVDNPSVNGTVNRVVQGVIIHPLEK